MSKPTISHISPFEQTKKINEFGEEYWSARDLMRILGYAEFRNFTPVIKKAMQACENSGQNITDHFVQVHEMVDIGSKSKRNIADYQFSRYACYLIVQNANPSKEIVAMGQTYFAIQTRRQETQDAETEKEIYNRLFLRAEIKAHNTRLAGVAKEAGVVEPIDYAIFQNHGYKGLYGGLTQEEIHRRKDLKKSQKILDHMGSTELAANLFRATQTEEKIKREQIRGKHNANMAHLEVGKQVRKAIKEIGGTMPEELPSAESIKKIEKQIQKKKLSSPKE